MAFSEVMDTKNGENRKTHEDYVEKVKVNGKDAYSFYDTGASKVAVKRELVKQNQYTGKKVLCRFANGTSDEYPTAVIEIDGEGYQGQVEAIVIPNLIKDLIVAPSLYARRRKEKEVSTREVAINTNGEEVERVMATRDESIKNKVTAEEAMRTAEGENETQDEIIAVYGTRSQSGPEGPRVERPLNWPALPDLKLTPQEVKTMQQEDATLNKYWDLAKKESDDADGCKEHPLYVVKKGLLFRKYREVLRDEVRLQLMVPEKLREKVMCVAHESLLSAHQGIRRTQERVSAEFYWPSMLDTYS